ncbi:MAG TPA: Bax inhibitor-1/YccA family protein [Bacilli bacterium]|nr:Bax inhibitor-1/YccA family protein [Bacilli bacterium]HPZ27524.1 Bax inhibitor-1/YccA family protein [Bacilli bacterium]HQC89798.1 Bax inhibitor-1/YccA family protein [Bacilli bacterium]
MNFFRSHNPVYRRALNETESLDKTYEASTYAGVARKALFYIALVLVGAFGGLALMVANAELFVTMLIISLFTTTIFALFAFLIPSAAKVFGSLYCLAEGLLVGVVSLAFEAVAPGVVLAALLSTVVVLTLVVTLFLTGTVKVTSKFIRFLMIFALSILVTMLLLWIISLFIQIEFDFRIMAVVSGIMIFLCTLYLFFDLEMIRRVVEGGAPKFFEWYVAFGLVFTLVWLYMEILPLLARLMMRRD